MTKRDFFNFIRNKTGQNVMKIRNEVISSRNNPIVKWAASLADKKGREAEKAFIAEGEKLTLEALSAGLPVTHVFVCEGKSEEFLERLRMAMSNPMYADSELITLSESAFCKISTEKAPQGVSSVIKYLDFFCKMDIIYKEDFCLLPDERALALCSVRDPGNLGAVIRGAVAFGIDHLILSSDCADIYNPKTVRSAMGSLFKTRITTVTDFSSFVSAAKAIGRRVFAAELTDNARPLSEVALQKSDVIIIGNEGHGIPTEISSAATGSVYIPISEKTESLNASVAASIFMWEQSKTV